jgi:RNA polymerase sigma-70 factor (ECF subfamily)
MADIEALVTRARKGDREAFTELVARTYTDTYTLAVRLTGNDADAADVVQDTYVRAFKSITNFRGESKFTTWLYRIAANCASTHMSRTRRNRHELLDDDYVVVDTAVRHDPELSADNDVLHGKLVGALESLPKSMREVVVLRDVYDLTHDDISNELGISVTAAKVRLHRARKRLRQIVDDVGGSDDGDVLTVSNALDQAEVELGDAPSGKGHHAM